MKRLVSHKDWETLVSKTEKDCYDVGKLAVYPGIQDDLVLEKLTRANERLRFIDDIRSYASQVEGLKNQMTELTGKEIFEDEI